LTKPSPYGKLRTILMASMTLVPLIPFLCVMAIGYRYFTQALETSTLSAMERIVADHRRMIDAFLSERRADLEFITRAYRFEQVSRPEVLSELFENLQRASHAYVDLGIFDTNGVHVAYSGPYSLTGKVYMETDWFREAERRGYYISDVFLGYRNIPHFVVAVSRNSPRGRWMIRATIDSLLFNDLVKEVRLGKTGEAYVINSKGVLQTDRRSGGDLMQTLDDAVERPETQEQIRTFLAKDARSESYLYATALLKGGEWMLVARQEQSDAFSALYSAAYLILFISGTGGVVVVVIAQFMTGRIVRHMERTDAEKDRLRYQLIGAARLVELGEMAAGFAHEVNNPLQIIRNEQSLMEMNLSELPIAGTGKEEGPLAEIHDSLAQIRLQIDRCAEITQAILKFGRQQEARIREVDLGGVISETAAMVANKIHIHGIVYTEEIDPATPPVASDPAQLQQVFVNLFNNAIDAVIERHGGSGGTLRVEVYAGENGTADVRVEDNGTGIAPENMEKIFSPFFTTKPVGKGSGLGLSVCYGIVDTLGGTMAVESRQGEGTVFLLRFPGAGSPESAGNRTPSVQRSAPVGT